MTSSEEAATKALRAYLADDWTKWLTQYPELATSFGFPGLDDRWTNDSESGIDQRKRHLTESLERLRGLDAASLPSRERVNHRMYRELLELADTGLAFGLDPLPFQLGVPHNLLAPLNQMEGVHLTASETLEIQPRGRLADYEALLSRLNSLATAVDQNRDLLEAGRKQGVTPHRYALRGVVDQVRGLIPDEPVKSPLLRAFTDFPSRIGESDRARLTMEATKSYTDRVVPAFERLHEYLETRYLPACREAPGVSALPNGTALYAFLVGWETTTGLTPQQVHEIGLGEVRRLRTAMEGLMKATGFSGGFSAFLDFLRTDDRFFYSDAETLVDGYRVITKKIDPGLARLFGRLPRLPYGVVPVPAFRAASSPTAYYMPGAPATGRPGMFFANTSELHSRPRWEMEALSLHEAVPGHHLQIALAQEVEDVPDFRRFTGPTAFVEGWGLYAESLGEELGMYPDAYSKMGQYTYDMWRSIRLVVDTGIHALGWSRDDAIRYFRENAGKADIDIAVEVDRYINWPAQALAYKVGQLKIRELRTWA
ncbi:MAG TPA: DUF885 domain-containing protein, partial [Thermoplasmata archaeon]|nr:DUF885 domain-containing protein [Thermoplasmata archaeon]